MRAVRRVSAMILLAVGAATALSTPGRAFDCAETKCGDIKSCAEAHYKLTVCGHAERDRDDDGIPCETHCSDDHKIYADRVKAQWPKDLPPPDVAKRQLAPSLISPAEAADTDAFSCGAKRTCKQMSSCEEATFHLKSCGQKSLDGDGDGVPCNALCR